MDISDSIDADDLIEEISQHELHDSIYPLLDSYEQTIGDRNRFFWQWLDHLFPAFTLSCVDSNHFSDVRTAKLLVSIFVTLLDDVAEKHDDHRTFKEAAKVPFDHVSADPTQPGVDPNVVTYAQTLWDRFTDVRNGPRETEFQEILEFDLKQVLTAIEYSYITNHNLAAVTEHELWTYDVHNVAVFVYADLDLMSSPGFDIRELTPLRQVIRHTERIARICNWVTTWERELHEGDCSSGVVVHALNAGIVSLDDLQALREDASEEDVASVIQTINDHDVEDYFRQRLHKEYEAAEKRGVGIDSVDVDSYLDGFKTVEQYHMACRDLL